MTKTLEQITKMNYLGHFTNAWGERNEMYESGIDGTCYDVVYDSNDELVMICTLDIDDDEMMPIEILYRA